MLNRLIPVVMRLKGRYPRLFTWVIAVGKRVLSNRMGVYPRPLGKEVSAAAAVIRSSNWNMTAGAGLVHERLESAFAEYIGVPYAVAVNTGGMALQMSLRALGCRHGDEVIHQVDTCSATALAVIAAGCTPMFADISERTFMLDSDAIKAGIGSRTKALLATHMWGNPEDMPSVMGIAHEHGLHVIEDACLSLGAASGGRMAGSRGTVGVFSFGCMKPIQGGEGGMIVTSNEALARELRSMRHWGDRTIEYGVRDTLIPSWNGRMSEIIAAVVHEQLKGYGRHLASLRDAVAEFNAAIAGIDGVELALGSAQDIQECSFAQVVLRIDESRLGLTKSGLKDGLYSRGVPVWHANFELINSISLFRTSLWKDWLPNCDYERTRSNYESAYPVAYKLMHSSGLGLGKMNFLSRQNLRYLVDQIGRLCMRRTTT